jgi:hypothetical protein
MPLYIELSNGREKPNQEMDEMGSYGPIFGPFPYINIACDEEIKLGIVGYLIVKDGLIQYDRKFYGNWSVFGHEIFKKMDPNTKKKLEDFEQHKANFYKGDTR